MSRSEKSFYIAHLKDLKRVPWSAIEFQWIIVTPKEHPEELGELRFFEGVYSPMSWEFSDSKGLDGLDSSFRHESHESTLEASNCLWRWSTGHGSNWKCHSASLGGRLGGRPGVKIVWWGTLGQQLKGGDLKRLPACFVSRWMKGLIGYVQQRDDKKLSG